MSHDSRTAPGELPDTRRNVSYLSDEDESSQVKDLDSLQPSSSEHHSEIIDNVRYSEVSVSKENESSASSNIHPPSKTRMPSDSANSMLQRNENHYVLETTETAINSSDVLPSVFETNDKVSSVTTENPNISSDDLGTTLNDLQESPSFIATTMISDSESMDIEMNAFTSVPPLPKYVETDVRTMDESKEYYAPVSPQITENPHFTFTATTTDIYNDYETTVDNSPSSDVIITSMSIETKAEAELRSNLEFAETKSPNFEQSYDIVPVTEESFEVIPEVEVKREMVSLIEGNTEVHDLDIFETTETTETVPMIEQTESFIEETTTLSPSTQEDDASFINEEFVNTVIPVNVLDIKEFETTKSLLPLEEVRDDFHTVTTTTVDDVKELMELAQTPLTSTEESTKSFNGAAHEHTKHNSSSNTADLNNTDTSAILLETSLGVEQAITEGPLEPTSFDVKIKTIKDLKVEAIFDPTQIAKATSYEESSFSTATRSATVTTWVDPNSRIIVNQTYLKGNTKTTNDYSQGNSSESNKTSTGNSFERQTKTSLENTNSSLTGFPLKTNTTHILINDKNAHEFEINTPKMETLPPDFNINGYVSDGPQIPVLKFNLGEFESINGSRLYLSDGNKTGTQFVYEMPNIIRSSGPHLTPSVVIALSICCSFVLLLSILTVSLWFCRRHRNRSKIYLSRDVARPRAFFTKPMNPALLPDETPNVSDSMYFMEFQKPRPPIVLSDDPDCVIVNEQAVLQSDPESGGGIVNQGFVEIPLEEIKPEKYSERNKGQGILPPKIDCKGKPENDVDSGIRVWSSSGSLHAVSTESSHCFLPPPPYDSSIGKEIVDCSDEAFPSFGSKFRLLYA